MAARASVDLTVQRWCQATGTLLDVDVTVSGSYDRGDRTVGVGPGIEDLDVERLEIDGTRLPLVTPSGWWFDLTPAEEQDAETKLEDALLDRLTAQWEARHD